MPGLVERVASLEDRLQHPCRSHESICLAMDALYRELRDVLGNDFRVKEVERLLASPSSDATQAKVPQ